MAIDGSGSLLLLAAGAVAGVIGTAGGITSLVSYPALLAVGLGPLSANVANLVAWVACWPSSALTSRRELKGNSAILATAVPVAAVASGAGSLLLVATPPGVFGKVVPWLVLIGSAVLVAQPAITARRGARHSSGDAALLAWVAVLCVYGGYFGAGSGIMLLAALLLFHDPRLPHANALKNMLVGAGALASAVLFVFARPVVWSAVGPLAAGLFLGSLVGPLAARQLPAAAVRWTAAILGVALAVDLWVHPG
ncbi:sulfite exporter TauE/SafE family protein [uncultured Jatrophihabitans sp.]|uniref:sulfite exporter TauE/SafE family protein n=1 Tax=uncultured Jatrophihabitans sp. TaxID=1610747 RepID=UPI0035CC94C3